MSQRINQRINWKCFDFNVNLNVYILLSWLKTNLELVKWEINSNYTTKNYSDNIDSQEQGFLNFPLMTPLHLRNFYLTIDEQVYKISIYLLVTNYKKNILKQLFDIHTALSFIKN